MTWRRIGEEAGFTGGSVTGILQDRRGLMWIGASGGLFRYDGHGFRVFRPGSTGTGGSAGGLATSAVACLAEDTRGDIWIGTAGAGLFRHRVAEGGFERVELGGSRSGLATPLRMSALAADPTGNVLAGTDEGALFMSDSSGTSFIRLERPGRASEAVTSILADSAGRIWVGTAGGGLARYDGDGNLMARHFHDPSRASSIGSDDVRALLEDSLGSIWAGLESGADLVADGNFTHARTAAAATAVAEDARGRIWLGLSGGGMGILDPSSMDVEIAPFAADAEVTRLAHDRRGLIWAGLDRGGLLTADLRSAGFERFAATSPGLRLGSALALGQAEDGRVIVSGKGSGISAFDPAAAMLRQVPGGKAEAWTMHAADDGALWLGGSWPGLLRLDPAGRTRSYPVSGRPVTAILEDEAGRFLLGTKGGGLERFDPRTGVSLPEPNGPAGRSVSRLARDRSGRLWAGTRDSGLAVLEKGASHWRELDPGVGDLDIESLLVDSRGLLWVGSGGAGLVAIDPEARAIVQRGRESGLAADSILALAEDAAGTIWASTTLGLYALDPDRRTSFLYGPEDGLCGGALQPGALLAAADGQIWVGSGEGVARFDPKRVPRYAPEPEVAISELWSAGDGTAERTHDGSGISLAHDNAGLGFAIAAIDYLAPGRNRYAMKLEGRNPAWIQLGAVNSGYIAPLPPGSYMLRVKAAGANGIWNDYGASVAVTVRPPWWGTWWFRLSGSAILLAGLGAGVAARFGALRRRNALLVKFARHIEAAREEERTTASREVHDEIGQHLAVLSFQAYWLATHPEAAVPERSGRVGEMQAAIRRAMEAVRTVAGRLRPAALDTMDLAEALRLSLRSFEKMSGMETSLDLGRGWDTMSGESAGVVLRILQEALGNAARHSGGRRVEVRVFREGEAFVLSVRDDGKGIDASSIAAQDSFGIIGMRERCAALGGNLDIGAVPGGGCLVTAHLPDAPRPPGRRS